MGNKPNKIYVVDFNYNDCEEFNSKEDAESYILERLSNTGVEDIRVFIGHEVDFKSVTLNIGPIE